MINFEIKKKRIEHTLEYRVVVSFHTKKKKEKKKEDE